MRMPFISHPAYSRCCKPLTFSHPVGKWWYALLFYAKFLTTSEAGHSFMLLWLSVILSVIFLWTANLVHFFFCRSILLRILTLCHLHVVQIISLSLLSFNFDDILNKWIWGDVSPCFLTSLPGPIQDHGLNVHQQSLILTFTGSYHCWLGSHGALPGILPATSQS